MAMGQYKDEDWAELEIYIDAQFADMERERKLIEPLWFDISDYLLPRFANWTFTERDVTAAGSKIYDGAAIAAHSRLADGIFGWLVSPTIPWLAFEPVNPRDMDDSKLMAYLRELEMHMYDVFNRSNFYDAIAEDIRNSSGIGTAVMTIEDIPDLNRPVYTPLHPKEIYIAENRYGEVDTLFRKYQMTKRQFLQQFKGEYDQKEIKAIMDSRGGMVTLLHCVYPNEDFINDGGIKIGENKKYKSIHKIVDGISRPNNRLTNIIKVAGMDERMFEAHRFNRSSNQVYGFCPAMDAIYDIKMINVQSKTMADVAQLAARPPLQTSELMKGKLKIAPGGITYGYDDVKPIMTSFSYPIGLDAMTRREAIIREHFKTDFFQSISQLQQSSRDRTATEIMEVKAEAAAVMGSIVGRVQSERLEPMVRMTMYLEKKAGRLPPPPQGVDPKKAFTLKFVGPLAQSQKKYLRVQGIAQGLGSAVQFAMTSQKPETLINFDFNWAVRNLATANGYPAEGLISLQDVAKMQQQMAQQQQAMLQEQMQNEKMKAMGQGAAAPQEGSPAAAVMGGR